ncbi:NUDIX domain-containing protein [Thermodesulfobacteriota bacterium]
MHHHHEFKFCPVCGAELESEILKKNEPARLICPECEFVFYLDPKVVACAIIEIDKKIVLLKRSIPPERGKWVIPGGYVDRGEEVRSAAVRETMEECGLQVRIRDLLGVYSYNNWIEVVIVYRMDYISGELTAADESLEAGFFKPEEIPWDQLAFQSTKDALRDYLKLNMN